MQHKEKGDPYRPANADATPSPLSMGTVLHRGDAGNGIKPATSVGFSPLLDGDGVASASEQSHSTTLSTATGCSEALHFP